MSDVHFASVIMGHNGFAQSRHCVCTLRLPYKGVVSTRRMKLVIKFSQLTRETYEGDSAQCALS